MGIRSLVETVACQHLINQRNYLTDPQPLRPAYQKSEVLFAKLQAFRASIKGYTVREDSSQYEVSEELPF
jgi:hypothetical protein